MHSPFHYHQETVSHFKENKALWDFFATDTAQQEDQKHFRTELLKSTYRLEPSAEPAIYDALNKAKEILGIRQDITIYQLMQSTDLNAFVYAMKEEAHIVLSGNILRLLDEQELLSVLAHELGHIKLLAENDGDYLIADRLLNAMTLNAGTPGEYLETDRIFDLYTELYCDQMSLKVLGDPLPVISSLVKINTGLDKVSAESYIRQSIEIFEAEDVKTEHLSHPEHFIRAYALHIFQTTPELFEQKIKPVIQGNYKLTQLDIFSRNQLNKFSREMIDFFLADKTLQTETLTNLATQYFPDFKATAADNMPAIEAWARVDETSKEYIAYLLLDFALADQVVEQEAMRRAFIIAENFGIRELLKTVAKKELKLTEKKFNDRYKKTLAAYA